MYLDKKQNWLTDGSMYTPNLRARNFFRTRIMVSTKEGFFNFNLKLDEIGNECLLDTFYSLDVFA